MATLSDIRKHVTLENLILNAQSSTLGSCSGQLHDQDPDNVTLENLVKSHETLKQRVNDLGDYIKNELSKFNHSKERSQVLQ
ncbi:hypothetical protein BLOT_002076 [Blomia tropicalis]|nr:hypothetical protein BLOT_002076 [Blomia tropicalis]